VILLEEGRYVLEVRPVVPPKWRVMGLKEVRLRKVEPCG